MGRSRVAGAPTVAQVETAGRRREGWLLASAGVSILGDRFGELALPVVALEVTHSAWDTAGVAAAVGLPGLVAALVLARRIAAGRSRTVAGAAHMLQALAFAGLSLVVAGTAASLAVLVVFGLAVGVGAALNTAAMPTVVRHCLLDDRRLQRFNGLVEVVDGTATLAGPVLAGVALGALGASPALGIDGLSFALAGLIVLGALRPQPHEPGPEPPRPAAQRAGGLGRLVGDPEQRLLLAVTAAMNLQSGGIVLAVVLLSRRALDTSTLATGAILAAAGLGAIVAGALIVPRVPIEHWQAAVAASFGLCGIGLAALAAAPNLAVAAAANILVDAGSVVCFALTGTRRLQATPPGLLPHLSAVSFQVGSAASVAGVLLVGALAATIGPRWGPAGLAALTILAAAGTTTARTDTRTHPTPDPRP